MKKILRNLISLTLVLSMLLCTGVPAFASSIDTESGNLYITSINEKTTLLSDGTSTAIIKAEELKNGLTKLELVGTNNDSYLLIDSAAATIYSSITGKTISFEKQNPVQKADAIQPLGTGAVAQSYEVKVSYAELADLVGNTATAYDIAYAIAGVYLAIHGIAIASIAAIIMSALQGAMLTKILNGIKNRSSGGVKVVIDLCEITKHQGGRIVTGYGYKLRGVTTY